MFVSFCLIGNSCSFPAAGWQTMYYVRGEEVWRGRRRKRGEKQTLCKRSVLVLTYSQDLSPSFQVPSIIVRLLIIICFCCETFAFQSSGWRPLSRGSAASTLTLLRSFILPKVWHSFHFFTLFEALTEYAATCSPWHLHSAKYYFCIPGHLVFWQGRLKNT